MKLSIIIINYNSGLLTKACIESVLKQQMMFPYEIIAVDNSSEDESVSLLRSDFPEIRVMANAMNRGFAAAANKALARAKGEYYLLLNPDIITLPGSIETLVGYMERHLDAGVAGGKLISPNGELQFSCFRFYSPLTVLYRRTWLGNAAPGERELDRFLMKDFDHAEERNVDWLMGSCLMLRANAVKEVGGMDERFFLYFEDVDWCRRFWEKGWRVVYLPEAVFSHYHQRSSRQGGWLGVFYSRTVREHIKSAARYFLKYRGRDLPVKN